MLLVWWCQKWKCCNLSVHLRYVYPIDCLHYQRNDRRRLISTLATLLRDKFKRFVRTRWPRDNHWFWWICHHFLRISTPSIISIILWCATRCSGVHASMDDTHVGCSCLPSNVWAMVDLWLLHLFGSHYGSHVWLDMDVIQRILLFCCEISLSERKTKTASRHRVFKWYVNEQKNKFTRYTIDANVKKFIAWKSELHLNIQSNWRKM